MNVLSSSPAPAAVTASGTPARGNAAEGGADAGGFAEVLGQQLQRASKGREHDAASASARTVRTGARKLQDPADRETQEANALPLIAAALESRSLARADTEAPAAGEAAADPLGAQAAQADARMAPRGGSTAHATDSALAPPEAAADVFAALTPRDGHGLQEAGDRKLPALPATPSGATATTAAAARAGSQHASPEAAAAGAAGASQAATPAERATPHALQQQDAAPAHEPASASAQDEPSAATPSATVPVASGTTTVAAPTAPAAPAPVPAQGYVAPPVASRAWGPALGQEVARLHHAGHGQAQLELNPPGLGPLSVSISVADQQAHAAFVSPHPAVRAAVEAALPQLRSALADNGISLGQASVGAEHQSGSGAFSQAAQDQASQRRQAAPSFNLPERPATLPVAPRRTGAHMLDTFA